MDRQSPPGPAASGTAPAKANGAAAVEQPAISASSAPAPPEQTPVKSIRESAIKADATPATSVGSAPGAPWLIGEPMPATPTPAKSDAIPIAASAASGASGSTLPPAQASLSPDVSSSAAGPKKRSRGLNISFVTSAASFLSPRGKANSGPAAPAPPLKDVIKEATKELKQGGFSVASGSKAIMDRLKDKKPINITLDQVVTALFFSFLGFQLLLVKLFKPSPYWMMVFAFWGVLFGLGLSYLFYANKKRKAEACEVMGMRIGLKGLQHLVGNLPSWLSYTEREKIAWFNGVLEEVWPYYDKGVCKMVKKMTEGIFEQQLKAMKVPGIKKIAFKQLTFGDAPFRVESIHVSDKRHDAMVMEVDVRWCGEANITLAIELSAGEFTKMCPRVTDISFVGSLRIMLTPLVDTIPCFGAAVVTFRKPPRYKYRLDFGAALGGQYVAGIVKPFINYVINNVIVNMFVWPQRFVVPIIGSEEMAVEVAKLAYRSRGVLKVRVIQASGLKKVDVIGSADPFVEMTTDGKYTATTKVIRNTLEPKWGETFWLLVQEPTSQEAKVSVYDRDMFSAGDLLKLDVKGAFFAKELLGRTLVKLAPITSVEPAPHTAWYHLGEGLWSNPEGCGKGSGRIQLECIYRSFESFKKEEPLTATAGVVVVTIVAARNLVRGVNHGRTLTAFVKVRCGDKEEALPPVTSRGDHSWTNRNVYEFYGIKFSSDVKFDVFEKGLADDCLGSLEIPVSDVAAACDLNPLSGVRESGYMLRSFKLEDTESGDLMAALRYVPYF
uniref:C2 domain-containing protein n=1 Tax=Chlamydomonas leiostraca TaxID=1034604 RepID=A0A7S0RQP9_9CHLO|mmetsp:Transcript_29096/g.74243  ORF Transcript_29096/g.74243 Transcript_29096/m.74243 type:complete len:780 (+) Transcript_29096:100-2439(+)